MAKNHSTAHSKTKERDATSPEEDQTSDTEMARESKSSAAKAKVKYSRVKRRLLRHVWPIRIFLITVLLALLGIFIYVGNMLPDKIDGSETLKFIRAFVTADTSVVPSDNGRTNILLLGIGGEGHEGSDLTDTILFVSVPLEKKGIKMISVPRDIWIPSLRIKINSAYYWGIKNEVGGTTLAKTAVEPVLGTEIHYSALLDFNGFKRIIDELGGIEVNVQNSFTDPKYPIAGKEEDLCGGRDPEYKCRYETITFNQGIRQMDGETALKFVRSRHAEGDEGTDFARSARQQRVIEGIKNKLLTKEILLNRKKIESLWNVGNETIKTDIPTEVMAVLARKALSSKDDIESQSIPEDLLDNPRPSPRYDGLYVLIPRAGDNNWTEINEWTMGLLNR